MSANFAFRDEDFTTSIETLNKPLHPNHDRAALIDLAAGEDDFGVLGRQSFWGAVPVAANRKSSLMTTFEMSPPKSVAESVENQVNSTAKRATVRQNSKSSLRCVCLCIKM